MEIIFLILFGLVSFFSFISMVYFWNREEDVAFFSFWVFIFMFSLTLILIAITWNIAYGLPYEYIAASDTIEETSELLMKYENLSGNMGNIGNGLESMELKQRLADSIEYKNNAYQSIRAYLNNPFAVWKGTMMDRCIDLGIEI